MLPHDSGRWHNDLPMYNMVQIRPYIGQCQQAFVSAKGCTLENFPSRDGSINVSAIHLLT